MKTILTVLLAIATMLVLVSVQAGAGLRDDPSLMKALKGVGYVPSDDVTGMEFVPVTV